MWSCNPPLPAKLSEKAHKECQPFSLPGKREIADMLTDNRKRHRSCDSEEDQQLSPQAKRSGGASSLVVSDLDSESSSSDSSNGISSPEGLVVVTARPCIHSQNNCTSQYSPCPKPEDSASSLQHGFHGDGSRFSYDSINRVLREAHFSSLQSRGSAGST